MKENVNKASSLKISRVALLSLGLNLIAYTLLLSHPDPHRITLPISLFTTILALILGVISLVFIRAEDKKLKGRGYAITTILLTLFYILVGMNSWARFMDYKGAHNLNELSKAINKYAGSHDGYLPTANRWYDILIEYDRSLSIRTFRVPLANRKFAFNQHLDAMRVVDIPEDAVLLFEAEGEWNINGGAELLKQKEDSELYVLLVNGEIHRYRFERGGIKWYDPNTKKVITKPLRWKP